ncbi:DMSO/TMAO reductase YedYZ molybdopterin-dependent catalytic subunit [Advenella incenata]|jgi:DMSO/TMAO reductase YedYZ molybdopterin-dependent catalytic subunit|uniref:DMSO/TMAO reductase YedYZ molybdopterin-dependent catalytic subunit n=1 Tax=Advenella incenata TaxID=267800 RepID=A0A4Q7VSC7_9BURK|nr:sulfite oxidase [Advenella incenata]RZT99453.1 DMSO/TMAO reductase YedYZ molybdopterin-dependent catalytic subunit [Advenella incenata]
MKELTNAGRRQMLISTGSIAAMAGLAGVARADLGKPDPGAGGSAAKPLPAYASWKDADSMIVHSANTIETRRMAFGNGVITPTNRLFVRNNVAPPTDANMVKEPESWTLEVSGVAKPRSFTVAELKTLGLAAVPMVLQCSGNGRAWFPHKPSGTQWTVGAAGCVIFTGVPVKALLEAVGGMTEGMVYMTSTGGEPIPQGLDPNTIRVERSVPISAMEDAILAWEINGEALPLAHGGPLRIIVPGYTGVNSIKYIKHLSFTKEQSPAKIQQTSYRWSPVGEKSSASHDSIWELPVKSWINYPSDPEQTVAAGRVQISGIAMGGMTAAKSIEVSVNGGKDWKKAEFVGPDLGRYAWREFVFSADLAAGTHELACRATNEAGDTQPEARRENNRGYINNSWRDHMVAVKVA